MDRMGTTQENIRDCYLYALNADAIDKGMAQELQLRSEISALKQELNDKCSVMGSRLKDSIYEEEHYLL